MLLDEKVKKFVQTKFQSVVDKFNSIEESIKEAIAYKEEEFENNYQLPTTVSEVKAKKHDPQIIHSQQFLMKLPFWVSAIVVGMIVSTYFF